MLVKISKHENGYLYTEVLAAYFYEGFGEKNLFPIVCICGCLPGIDCLELIDFKCDCISRVDLLLTSSHMVLSSLRGTYLPRSTLGDGNSEFVFTLSLPFKSREGHFYLGTGITMITEAKTIFIH